MNYGHWTLMKFHREALISNISYSAMSTCPLGANQPFEGLIRLSICCQLCSFSSKSRHLGQVTPVTKLICIQANCNQRLTRTEPLASRSLSAVARTLTPGSQAGRQAATAPAPLHDSSKLFSYKQNYMANHYIK